MIRDYTIRQASFFNLLSQYLWKIDNHPFRKLTDTQATDDTALSYNPKRVFKGEDDDPQIERYPEYVEFQKQEFESELAHQNYLLKKELQQKHSERISRVNLDATRYKPFSIFKAERGQCMRCYKCPLFCGNFSLDPYLLVDIFSCYQCGCPMNSHPVVNPVEPFSNLLYEHVKKKELNEKCINSKTFVVAFSADRKILRYNHTRKLMQLMNYGGYPVIGRSNFDLWEFKHLMAQQKLFARVNKTVNKYSFDLYLHFFRAFQDLPTDPINVDFREYTDYIKEKLEIYTKLRKMVDGNMLRMSYSSEIFVFFIRSDRPMTFRKFVSAIRYHLEPYKYLYSSPDKYWSVVDGQLFFPGFFRLCYETMLVPQTKQIQQNPAISSDKLKDILDFNGYIVVKDEFGDLSRAKIETAFADISNSQLLQYVLGQHIVSYLVPQIGLRIVSKLGPSHFTNFSRNLQNVVRITDNHKNYRIFKELCPYLLTSQRCAIVLRPMLVRSDMDYLVLNCFRLNDFTIISRVFVQLTEEQAEFFCLLEAIEGEDQKKAYYEMMKSGLSQIILLSKRACIFDSRSINEGCQEGLKHTQTRLIKETPWVEVKYDGKVYREEVPIKASNAFLDSQIVYVFNGIKHLFDLEKLIFTYSDQYGNSLILDTSNGQLVRQDTDSLKHPISQKITESLLQEISSYTFNFWMYSSTSYTITYEIISQFMPECGQFESICVLVKPGFSHLIKNMRQHLYLMKYKIIGHKTVLLSKNLASNIVNGLLILRLDQETRDRIINRYASERVEVICVAKPAGKRYMLSFLSGFTLGYPKQPINPDQPLTDAEIKQLLVPAWNNYPQILQVISNVLSSIEENINDLEHLSANDKHALLNYLCGSILGVTVEGLPIRTTIGNLSYYTLKKLELAKIQSWYYATINRVQALYVPLIFQYREYGSTVFCLQSDSGEEFIQHVIDSYSQEPREQKKQKSVTLYLWAKKLTHFVKSLSEIRSELTGFGRVDRIGDCYRGELTSDTFLAAETRKVNKCLSDPLIKGHKDIVKTLSKVVTMRGFKDRANYANKRLVPLLQDESLRVVKTSQITKLHMVDQFYLIDPQHELRGGNNLNTLNLFNIEPSLMPKYGLFSQVYLMLLKASSLSKEYGKPLYYLLKLFLYLSERNNKVDLEMMSIETYLTMLDQYMKGNNWLLEKLMEGLPNIAAVLGQLNDVEEVVEGKRRKFIYKSQYYTRGGQENYKKKPAQDDEEHKHYMYNVYEGEEKPEKGTLYDPDDPLHSKWASETRVVNLLREYDGNKQPRRGVYVEYEKKINDDEELIKAQVNKQVEKYLSFNQEYLLYETGLEKNIWYRRAKDQYRSQIKPPARLDEALDKQVQRFLKFKDNQK